VHAGDRAVTALREAAAFCQARDDLAGRLLVAPAGKRHAILAEGAAGPGNIVGVGIGAQEAGGRATGRLALKVFVVEKRPRATVSAAALVPARVGGLPTDVEAVGRVAAQMYVARHRPAPCGVSIGSRELPTPGTLGCVVTRAGRTYILGTNHILALLNRSRAGTGIPQPGGLDGGTDKGDVIARLARFVPITRDRPNRVDAAIALTSRKRVDPRVLQPDGTLRPLVSPEVAPALGMPVQKCGRTTGHRLGRIDAVGVTLDVDFAPLGGTFRFTDQFRVRGSGDLFSDTGDSGALVTTFPGNQPVGLLFSGNASANMSFCNDIGEVLRALDVAIVY
jgi:hypothetical protein